MARGVPLAPSWVAAANRHFRELRAQPRDGFSVVDESPNLLIPWQLRRLEAKCKATDDGTGAAPSPDGSVWDCYVCEWDDDAAHYIAQTDVANGDEILKLRSFTGEALTGLTGKDDVSESADGTRLWAVHPMDRGDNETELDTWEPLAEIGAESSYGGLSGPTGADSGNIGTSWGDLTWSGDLPNTADISYAGSAGTRTGINLPVGSYWIEGHLSARADENDMVAQFRIRAILDSTPVSGSEQDGLGMSSYGHASFGVPLVVSTPGLLKMQAETDSAYKMDPGKGSLAVHLV